MITVGTINTGSTLEKLVSTFIMLLLAGTFAYSINTIGVILKEINKSNAELNEKLDEINFYMNKRNLSQALKMKVRRYIMHMHEEKQQGLEKGKNILYSLSQNLKFSISIESYAKILKNVDVFKKNFSQEFIHDLAFKAKEMSIAPEEIICEVFYLINIKMIFFVFSIFLKNIIINSGQWKITWNIFFA